MQTTTRKKTLVGIIAILLICSIAVAGVLAYLQQSTMAVTNTFTASATGIIATDGTHTLWEHEVTSNGDGTYTVGGNDAKVEAGKTDVTQTYEVFPGYNIPKDPTITLQKVTQPAYLFVEVNAGSFKQDGTEADASVWGDTLKYTLDDTKWEQLKEVTGPNGGVVYAYKETITPADTKDKAQDYPILKKISVTDPKSGAITVTENTIEVAATYTPVEGNHDDLVFHSYLCQAGGFADKAAAYKACFSTPVTPAPTA
ncbi:MULTISPECIES: hypothetical protein [Gordonibacter]|uniref:Camelysin metallo-endopeptidase n=1 Tax=Gordonibacter faecis TaxID=3047475 RepID=A0ABT7DQD0_9ACTN|nr:MULTISPECIES: hypothetical protein [unclassified Gordonibacter]MDJ1651741.1 hypothetical protein [Gordonibacter sp. KGMB12511]HIW75723.1 hypothetical protein [Candidatus Gordonibacter avicola]